jgi:hypothetical protein
VWPALEVLSVVEDREDEGTSSHLLRVDRPPLNKPPVVPDLLAEWLERDWDDPLTELRAAVAE